MFQNSQKMLDFEVSFTKTSQEWPKSASLVWRKILIGRNWTWCLKKIALCYIFWYKILENKRWALGWYSSMQVAHSVGFIRKHHKKYGRRFKFFWNRYPFAMVSGLKCFCRKTDKFGILQQYFSEISFICQHAWVSSLIGGNSSGRYSREHKVLQLFSETILSGLEKKLNIP